MAVRILLVEDDLALRVGLSASLRAAGYAVTAVASAEEAEAMVAAETVDLVVLDWNLPGMSGIELLARWRAAGRGFPVIMLSARDGVDERVRGLEAGADDYVSKPFATEELLARMAVRLRPRTKAADGLAAQKLRIGAVAVDLARGRVEGGGRSADLSGQEAALLAYLVARPGQTVGRDELLREIWGYRGAVVTRAVDNAMARLRAKIEADPAEPQHLVTVFGAGYRFVE